MSHKTHYSCAELAAFRLPGYPTAERRMRDRVEREGWAFREVKSNGRNGLRREYQPPKAVAELIFKHLLRTGGKRCQSKNRGGTARRGRCHA